VSVTVYRAAPWTVRPFTLAGLVLGAATGWLLTVRALGRHRLLNAEWRLASPAFGLAALLTMAPFSLGNALFVARLGDGISATDCFFLVPANAVWLTMFAVVPAGLLLCCGLTLLAPPIPRSTPTSVR